MNVLNDEQQALNSNIEIHKSMYNEKFRQRDVSLNSNIEIHKLLFIFFIILKGSIFKF